MPGDFRLRFCCDAFHCLILPSSLLTFVLQLANIRQGYALTVGSYLAFILFWAAARRFLISWSQRREQYTLDARPIPCVVGKWPGNVDVLFRMMKNSKTSYPAQMYLDLFEEYQCTTLNLRLLWVDHIITMDQEHYKFVLTTGFHHFWRGAAQKERLETFLGGGIFNRDDETWKSHRNMARPFFARERVADFDLFEKYTSRTLSLISAFSSSASAFDAQDLFARFTIDTASEFLFGSNLDTLSASLPTPGSSIGPGGTSTHDSWGSFTRAFESAKQVGATRSIKGYFWPLFELFRDRNKPHAQVIHQFLSPLVSSAIQGKRAAGKADPLGDKTFLQHLAESTDDPIAIRDQLLNMLLASRDTTACLLSFTTYFLAIHPSVTAKLRAEILKVCGTESPPTYDQIRQMKYLRATLNEVLRLFPPVPVNTRESRSSSCVLPSSDATYPDSDPRGYYMPRNTVINYFPILIQRNQALWGPDADEFDPERWLDPARLGTFLSNPTIFTPFNAGPRICIGQNYAYNEASYFLVKLLQRYDSFTLATDCQPQESFPPTGWQRKPGRQAFERVRPAAALTLYIKGGLWVRFGRAS